MHHLGLPNGDDFTLDEILDKVKQAGDERLFFIGEALRRGQSTQDIHDITKIDMFFLEKNAKYY